MKYGDELSLVKGVEEAEIIISKLTKEKKWRNQGRENLHRLWIVTTVCYQALFSPLLYVTFLADFFEEDYCARHACTITTLNQIDNSNLKPKNKLWKKIIKIMPQRKMANPLYIQILKNGAFTPMIRVDESTDGDMVIPSHYAPKDPSEYTEPEKENVFLDSGCR
ncbi:hypothetical protein AgCh_025500 [Apium graveolens]